MYKGGYVCVCVQRGVSVCEVVCGCEDVRVME